MPLFQQLVEKYSLPNEIILDPFSGSGTTACACHELGRHFICIEREQLYYEASCKRLDALRAQQLINLNQQNYERFFRNFKTPPPTCGRFR